MAGHSKWANIRFRKGLQDAKRGKIFTKLIREITIAARIGGDDETLNARLRDVVTKALKSNMKRDTIDNAIKRGAGGLDDNNMIEMRYEGYAPCGVAILVDCLSDNKNRTVSEVRHVFTKRGGNLGTDGSVAYLFNKQGEILLQSAQEKEMVLDAAIIAGAEDVLFSDQGIEIITSAENYHKVLINLQKQNFNIEQSQLIMQAQILIPITQEESIGLMAMIDALEDLDDVQTVYTNAQFPDDFAAL